MGKKFNRNDLHLSSNRFKEYLDSYLNTPVLDFLEEISKKTEVVIFSGIIRNYFLNYNGQIRDLDIVVNSIDEEIFKIISQFTYRKNSFGGYKLIIDSLDVDLWELKNTWALKYDKVDPKLFEELNLPNTSFFNFSSIIYNYNLKEFIFNRDFEKFIESRELDLVLEENPLPQLCIINTIYYKEKFHLNIALNLKKYFVKNFNKFDSGDFSDIQLKHFGSIKYSYPFLKTYYKIFLEELNSAKPSL